MPAVNKTYTLGFKSHEFVEYDINISDTWSNTPVEDGEGDHSLTANDFKLTYKGTGDDVFDPVKSSHLIFNAVINNSADETIISDIFDTNFDISWYVRVYKKPSGGSRSLFWWGYLSPNTSQRPNEYFPFDYKLEALDILALLKGQKIWDKAYKGTIHIPALALDLKIPKHRFGSPRDSALTPFTLWPKEKPTVIEVIYSLLFDLDHDVQGDLYELMYWDAVHQLPGIGHLDSTNVKIWNYLFKDVPPKAGNNGLSIDPDLDADASEIMRAVCELFCLRIFQKDGDYHVVQPEAYQSGASIVQYKYEKNSLPNGSNPTFGGSNTLATTDYLKTVPTTQTDPKVLEGSYWEKLRGVHTTSLTGQAIGGVFDIKMSKSITGSTNNLSDLSHNKMEYATKFPLNGITYQANKPTQTQQSWTRGTGNGKDTYASFIDARAESRNQFRDTFEGTLFTDDYDFLHGISYFSKTYIPHTLTLNANDDHWSGKWIESRIESGGLDELILQNLSEQDLRDLQAEIMRLFWQMVVLNGGP